MILDPDPIGLISPTEANDLLACPLRVARNRSQSFSHFRKQSIAAVLGTSAHAVREMAYQLDLGAEHDWQAILEEEWDNHISEGHRQLIKQRAPLVPPPPSEWPNFQMIRVAAIRGAKKIAERRRDHSPNMESSTGTPQIEKWLSSPTLGIQGKVDRIDRINGQIRVVDIKTTRNVDEHLQEYERQLLLYALLIEEDIGEWPAEIAVEPIRGPLRAINADRQKAVEILAEIEHAVKNFNLHVEHGTISAQAKPSASACQYCSYAVVCDDYWNSLSTEWGHRSVRGEIIEIHESANGQSLTVRPVSPTDDRSGDVLIGGLATDSCNQATKFSGTHLRATGGGTGWTVQWSSHVDLG